MSGALAAGLRAPRRAVPLVALDDAEVQAVESGWHVRAVKTVRADDPYMAGHFPGFPIYPGVFLLETVQQAAEAALPDGTPPVRLTSVRSLRFSLPLWPDDRPEADVTVQPVPTAPEGTFDVVATVRLDGATAARAAMRLGPSTAGPSTAGSSTPGPSNLGAEEPSGRSPSAGMVKPALGPGALTARLPHGHPMVLLDRVLELVPGERVLAEKAVSRCEPCYAAAAAWSTEDAYAYPASLLVESLGQAAAVLWRSSAIPGGGLTEDSVLMFAAARDFELVEATFPGDVLQHEVRIDHVVGENAFVTGETRAAGRVVARVGSLAAVVRPRRTMFTSRNSKETV